MRRALLPGGLASLALAMLLQPVAHATGDVVRIGSFVSGERPMYLEIDRVVQNQSTRITIANLPAGSKDAILFFSTAVDPIDLRSQGIPGTLGPDLLSGGTMLLSGKTSMVNVPSSVIGQTLFVQAMVRTPKGPRLTSMETLHPRTHENPDSDPQVRIPFPLITQESVPQDRPGRDRSRAHVRVGVPMPMGYIADRTGVPALTLRGAGDRGQFSTLATWPDGSVKWALCEYFTDLAAGTSHQKVSVDYGGGSFGGSDLARLESGAVLIDTGSVQLKINGNSKNLFEYFKLQGVAQLNASKENRLHLVDSKNFEWTWHGLGHKIRRNGPVRAEIQVDGMFTSTASATDPNRAYVRMYVEARHGEPVVRVQVSLRNSSLQFPEHLQFRGLWYGASLQDAQGIAVRFPKVAKNGASAGLAADSLGTSQTADFETGFIENTGYELQTSPNSSLYFGFVQRLGSDQFAREGTCIRIAGSHYTGTEATKWFSTSSEYSDSVFMEINASSGRGFLATFENGSRCAPLGFTADGAGNFSVELLPRKSAEDTYHYPLTYATCETRTFYLVAESKKAADPIADAARLDYPVVARAPLWAYNQSKAWPWRLATHDQSVQFASHARLDKPTETRSSPTRTVFRYSGGTGGSNNNWGCTRRFYEWLRFGHGSALMWSHFESTYKVDKMAWSIDDGAVDDVRDIRNDDAPHTSHHDFFDGSKHIFAQSVPDVGFTRGDTYLLDSGRHFKETFMSEELCTVHPYGNFVAGYYGAVGNASIATLKMQSMNDLEEHIHLYMSQWVQLVFKRSNNIGVDTYTKGWQAPLGTKADSETSPDSYWVHKAGKDSYWRKYGYMTQIWSHSRHMGNLFINYVHHLREHDPNDPLIGQLLSRGADMYHYMHRAFPDDHCPETGQYYILDVFRGDADSEDVDPYAPPGDWVEEPNKAAYTLHGPLLLYLETQASESAYSYGVELVRSMSDNTWEDQINDPIMNEFMIKYLIHHGVIEP